MIYFDQIIQEAGDWGHYQKVRFVLLLLTTVPAGIGRFIGIILIMTPHHWCRPPGTENLPDMFRNLSSPELRKLLIPHTDNPDTVLDIPNTCGPSKCQIRDAILLAQRFNTTMELSELLNLTSAMKDQESLLISCPNGWEYDPEDNWSLMSEWDLVCSWNYMGSLLLTLNFAGRVVGTFISLALLDKIGRKPTFFIILAWYILFTSISAVMPSITAFIIVSTVGSFAAEAMFVVLRNMSRELVGSNKKRYAVDIMMGTAYALGQALLALLAYLIYSWRVLVLVTAVPMIIFFISWFILDESPHWLLSKGKVERAREIIHKMAAANGNKVDEDQLEELSINGDDDEEEVKVQLISMLKHVQLVILSLVMAYLWSVNVIVSFGLILNSENFGGNKFLVFALIALIQIPAEFFDIGVAFCLGLFGRIWPFSLLMTFSGLALVGASLVPINMVWLIIILAVFSKFCIALASSPMYQITEMFPTDIRGSGTRLVDTVSQILGIVTPFIAYSANVHRVLPMLILGLLGLSGGILTCFLPETLNAVLLDTVEDVEEKSLFGCFHMIENVSCVYIRPEGGWSCNTEVEIDGVDDDD